MRAALTASLFALTSCASHAGAQAPDDGPVLGIVWENDLFAGEDKKYTNGGALFWTPQRGALHGWGAVARDVLGGVAPGSDWRVGYGVGHAIFTSSDITDPDPPEDDRPYAGYLGASAAVWADAGDRLHVWSLEVGLVGPSARGEEIQSWVHRALIGDDPQGWDVQLRDEVAFRLSWEHARRIGYGAVALGPGVELEAQPRVALTVGTLETSAGAGLGVRLGENLRADWGAPRLRRGQAGPSLAGAEGWRVFASADALAVGRNLFLDGNSFRDSRSVDPERLVAELQVGAAWAADEWSVGYTHVFRSPEFTSQDDWTSFGSVVLERRF